MTRSFPQEQCHIFYDMGAGSTVASLACFQDLTVKDVGKFNKTVQQIEIKSVGYDRTLGGHEFDVRLQKLLAEKFQEQKGTKISMPVVQNERAMAKLLKEANRVKQILSANTETMASVCNIDTNSWIHFVQPLEMTSMTPMVSKADKLTDWLHTHLHPYEMPHVGRKPDGRY